MQKEISYDKIQSVIAMFIAWFIGYLYFAIRMVHFTKWGYVTDFTAIFFWTGLFAFVSVFTFVPLIIFLFRKLHFKNKIFFFPIFTTLISQVALTILLLPFTEMNPLQMGLFYFTYAAVIGLAFGLLYLWFQSRSILSSADRLRKKIIILLSPILFLFFLFYIFPYSNSTLAYKYFGDSIKDKATFSVLNKFKAGNKIKDLNNELPSFGGSETGKGSMMGSLGDKSYEIEYDDGIITKITITNHPN